MHAFLLPVYRIVVPKFIRKRILARRLPVAIRSYYDGLSEKPSEEIAGVLKYLSKNPIAVFPNDFQDEYQQDSVEVFFDREKDLRYVLLEGKKLYFKRKWGIKKIQSLFNLLSKEQDHRSPHRYLTDLFAFNTGDVLYDVGAAEGNFALSVVERASRIILFEADREWIEPLKATFEPWKEKVEIVNKYVGDFSNATHTVLDNHIFAGESETAFVKIDVEGAESKLLKGSHRMLSEMKRIKIAICTYHKQNDEKEFSSLLKQYGFETATSEGYMLFFYDKLLRAPYFRRGLIRAQKN